MSRYHRVRISMCSCTCHVCRVGGVQNAWLGNLSCQCFQQSIPACCRCAVRQGHIQNERIGNRGQHKLLQSLVALLDLVGNAARCPIA